MTNLLEKLRFAPLFGHSGFGMKRGMTTNLVRFSSDAPNMTEQEARDNIEEGARAKRGHGPSSSVLNQTTRR